MIPDKNKYNFMGVSSIKQGAPGQAFSQSNRGNEDYGPLGHRMGQEGLLTSPTKLNGPAALADSAGKQ